MRSNPNFPRFESDPYDNGDNAPDPEATPFASADIKAFSEALFPPRQHEYDSIEHTSEVPNNNEEITIKQLSDVEPWLQTQPEHNTPTLNFGVEDSGGKEAVTQTEAKLSKDIEAWLKQQSEEK